MKIIVFHKNETLKSIIIYIYSLVQWIEYTFDAVWSKFDSIPHQKCIQFTVPYCTSHIYMNVTRKMLFWLESICCYWLAGLEQMPLVLFVKTLINLLHEFMQQLLNASIDLPFYAFFFSVWVLYYILENLLIEHFAVLFHHIMTRVKKILE